MTEHKARKNDIIPSYTAPTSWEEVTVKQFYRLRELSRLGGSALFQLVHRLQTLTGVPAETWANAPQEVTEKHLGQFSFTLTGVDWENLPLPKQVTINGKKHKIRTDLRGMAFGKTISMEAVIDAAIPRDEEEPDVEKIIDTFPMLVALLIEDQVSGNGFDEDRATAFVDTVNNMAAMEVLPLGFFLSQRLVKIVLHGRKSWATSLLAKK